jgi:hypothetical protein
MLTSSRPKGGQHDTINEEDCRDARSGEVRRRCSSGSAAAEELGSEGLNDYRTPAAILDPAIATMHYSTATHYR